jgi:putative ABC transport system permease protein
MLSRFLNLFRRKRLDRELDAEFRYHLESLEAEHRARGLPAEEARRAARRDFGALGQIEEAYRDRRGIPVLETLWRDIRFSLRSMRRTPAVTLAVIATLALGIGANTAIFSVVNGVLIKPLPYPDPDRLITMSHSAPGVNVADVSSAPFLYFTEREQNRTLEGVGLFGSGSATVTGAGEPELVRRLFVTSDILPVLGIEPLLGRYFSQSDDAPGSPNTVVLSYGYWQRRFGGDRSVVGRSLTIDGQPWNIIGVMSRQFRFLDQQVDVITPNRLDRARVTLGNYFRRSIARLKPGVTLEQASADVERMIRIAIESFPPSPGSSLEQVVRSGLRPNLRPLKQDVVGDAGNTLWVLMGTIGLVLLIACANVANLILVRMEGRQQELSIRAALGAGWGRILRALLTESAVLSFIGGTLGVGFAYGSLRMLLAMAPANLPRREEIALDSTVLLFSLGLSLFSGLLFGTIPVVRYARPRLTATLYAGARWSSGSRERLRARGILVVAQVALALVLLVGAGLMIRTFQELNNVNPGFAGAGEVQTLQIGIPEATVREPERTARRQQEILNRLAALPGVTSAAYISDLPMAGGVAADLLVPEGRIFREGESPRSTQSRFISPGVFGTLHIPLVTGRDLTWTEIYERRPVALISENLARLEWGTPEEALGKRLRGSSAADQWREIIGVVGDIHDRGLSQPVTAIVYYPVLGERVYNYPTYVWRSVTYAIRSPRTGTAAFLDEIRQAVWAVDSNLPLVNVRTMGDILDASMSPTSFTLVMLAIAGAMALLLGVIGMYGAISYGVSQRTREIGVRIALGAQSGQVQRMFLRQGLLLTAAGVAVGLLVAVALTRWMSSLLFEVSPLDPLTYAAVSLVLVLASALASYLPSRRATHVDPIDSLRAQ